MKLHGSACHLNMAFTSDHISSANVAHPDRLSPHARSQWQRYPAVLADAEHGEDALAGDQSLEEKATIAQYIDKQLEEEFKNEELASLNRVDLNETMAKEKARRCLLPRTEH